LDDLAGARTTIDVIAEEDGHAAAPVMVADIRVDRFENLRKKVRHSVNIADRVDSRIRSRAKSRLAT
jgi:hypothetical protein